MSASKSTQSVVSIDSTPSPTQWPQFTDGAREAVDRLLQSGQVNAKNGPMNRLFEEHFSRVCRRRFAGTVCNGTAALELAYAMLELAEGDEVIVPARGFIANASAVLRVGAKPVFADVCPHRQSVTRATVEAVLTPRTRAISVVHLGGVPADIQPILELARAQSLSVIEDISQAHGASIEGQPVGSFGDMSVASFCQDKILTTGGEGGMLLTDDARLIDSLRTLRDHGQSRQLPSDASEFIYARDALGSNYRLSELQAAIGVEQLKRLDAWVEVRQFNARVLDEILGELDDVFVWRPPSGVASSYYRYYVTLGERFGDHQAGGRAIRQLNEAGVPASMGSCPELYREPLFADNGAGYARLPNARRLGERSFALPVHPGYDEAAIRDLGYKTRTILTNFYS